MPKVVQEVVDQHAEEAAFLWLLRDGAVRAPHYLLADLVRLDNRIEAHLDGLRIAGEPGWEICARAMADGDAGEVFAAAVLAFESGIDARIQAVLNASLANPLKTRGLVSALGWLPLNEVEGLIKKLLDNNTSAVKRLGIAAAAVHRWHPGQPLNDALAASDLALKARALRAAGELGLIDYRSSLRRYLSADDAHCRFWAAWSATLLAQDDEALAVLQTIARTPSPLQERAVQLVVRRMQSSSAGEWLAFLAERGECRRAAVLGFGALGLPEVVPWLIEQMKVPLLARVAGEAVSMITGVHIAYDKLEGEPPEGFESGPTENPEDENVTLDPDENLAWPKAEAVEKWWSDRQDAFVKGKRYLVGKPVTLDWLHEVLQSGYQRQRAAAALELAIQQPGQPLFEVRSPGFRQMG